MTLHCPLGPGTSHLQFIATPRNGRLWRLRFPATRSAPPASILTHLMTRSPTSTTAKSGMSTGICCGGSGSASAIPTDPPSATRAAPPDAIHRALCSERRRPGPAQPDCLLGIESHQVWPAGHPICKPWHTYAATARTFDTSLVGGVPPNRILHASSGRGSAPCPYSRVQLRPSPIGHPHVDRDRARAGIRDRSATILSLALSLAPSPGPKPKTM